MPLQIAVFVMSVLIGSGALVFFFRYGTRLAFAERDSTQALALARRMETEHTVTTERVKTVEKTLEEISNSLSKLSMIEVIKTTVDSTKDTLEDLRDRMDSLASQAVLRPEIEARLANHTQDITQLTRRLDHQQLTTN